MIMSLRGTLVAWYDKYSSLTFIFILNTFLYRICGSSKDCFPYLSVDRHESWKETNFSFWGFGRRLGPPDHELEDSGPDTITESVQSARWHVK